MQHDRLKRIQPVLAACAAAAALCIVAGCGPQPSPAPAPPPPPTAASAPVDHAVTGVIKELKPDGLTVSIAHDEIPGYMEAMTMPFRVKDPAELSNLQPNDQVAFRLRVLDTESWIDQVKKIGVTHAQPTVPRPTTRIVREVEPLEIGDPVPNYPFTNQLGRIFHFADLKGRAFAFTFIYTRCPIPDFCPRMSIRFQEAAQILAQRSSGPTNWHLVSLTFDVDYDTPDRLKDYASRYPIDPSRWTLATGALIDIDALTEQVGLVFSRGTQGFVFDHSLRTVVIDPRGRLHKIFIGNTWEASQLAEAMVEAAAAKD